MMTTRIQLASVDNHIRSHEQDTSENESHVQKQQPQTKVSEYALEWIDEYPQFKTDAVFNASALAVNQMLVNEGFDPNSEEFYEELTDRIAPRFPEIFVPQDENSVQLDEEDEIDPQVVENERDVKKSSGVKKKHPQTVSGGTRTPLSSKKSRKGKTIEFSAEDQQLVDRWGLDIKTVARRSAHIEDNNVGGYTPIQIS
jgi:hypothetical protein